MTTCACCGTPTPAPERVLPLGIQYLLPLDPRLILWQCPGAREVDRELLRFGVIALAPWSCGTTRATPWEHTTFDLRQRAFDQERLRLAMDGLI